MKSQPSMGSICSPKQHKQKQPSISLNIYLNGATYSGKTSIIQKLMNKQFNPNTVPTTLEHHEHLFHVSEQETIKLILWDYGGYEKFESARISAISTKNWNKVNVIVYDVTDRRSFQLVPKFVEEWNRNVEKDHVGSIILVANKIDLEKLGKRVVTFEEGLQMAVRYNIVYTQSSTKLDVQHIFRACYYLKSSQSQRQTIIQPYISSLEAIASMLQIQSGHIYRLKQTNKARDIWENIMAPILYKVGKYSKKLFHQSKQSACLTKFYDQCLEGVKEVLIHSETYNELMCDVKMFHAVLDMLGQPQSIMPRQSAQQPEYLSTNTISPTHQIESNLSKLLELAQNRVKEAKTCLSQKISHHNQQIKLGQQKIEIYFTKLLDSGEEKSLTDFMNILSEQEAQLEKKQEEFEKSYSYQIWNNKLEVLEGIQTIGRGESCEISDRKSTKQDRKTVINEKLQPNNNKSAILKEQTSMLTAKIKEQYASYQNLRSCLTQLHDIFVELSKLITQEINQPLQKQEGDGISQTEAIQNMLTFYIQQNARQVDESIQDQRMQENQKVRYAENKIQLMKGQYLSQHNNLVKQIEEQSEKLRKRVIEAMDLRRTVRISRHQCSVMKYWVEARKSDQSSEQANSSSITSFFKKIFG